jgi:hypothetical protein
MFTTFFRPNEVGQSFVQTVTHSGQQPPTVDMRWWLTCQPVIYRLAKHFHFDRQMISARASDTYTCTCTYVSHEHQDTHPTNHHRNKQWGVDTTRAYFFTLLRFVLYLVYGRRLGGGDRCLWLCRFVSHSADNG